MQQLSICINVALLYKRVMHFLSVGNISSPNIDNENEDGNDNEDGNENDNDNEKSLPMADNNRRSSEEACLIYALQGGGRPQVKTITKTKTGT